MPEYIGHQPSKIENFIFMAILIVGGMAMFIVLSQPAWRGEAMVAEMRADCKKVGGVMLEHKKAFGTSYECAERLDR